MTENNIIKGLTDLGFKVIVMVDQASNKKRFIGVKANEDTKILDCQVAFDMTGTDLFTIETEEFSEWLTKKIGLTKSNIEEVKLVLG